MGCGDVKSRHSFFVLAALAAKLLGWANLVADYTSHLIELGRQQ
jgi:hypothetical protein